MLQKIDECVMFKVLVSLVIKTDFDHIDFHQYWNSTSYHPATDGQSWHRTPFETYDQILVRKSDHCSRISTGSFSPRTIRVCTSIVFDCNRSTHLVHLLSQKYKLNVQDVYIIIFRSTAAVPGFPTDSELLSDKVAGLGDNIKDHSVYTNVCMNRDLSCYNTRPHVNTWLNNSLTFKFLSIRFY
jgi:hypothetical protein